jgi:hypothetical protein
MILARPPCSWAVQPHKQAEVPAVFEGFGASHPRQIPLCFKNWPNQIGDRDHLRATSERRTACPATGLSTTSLFHSSNVLGVLMPAMTVQRGADAEKTLKPVAEIVSIVAIETIRAIIDRKLRAESDINSVAMR